MNLIGLMPVRNEAWVLGLSVRVALMWCDSLVILDHASTDASRDIIETISSEDRLRDRIARLAVESPDWDEMSHRQLMVEFARSRKATHVAIIDADEILTGNLLEGMRVFCEVYRGSILQLPGYNLRGSIDRYHANGIWGNRWFSTAFADDPRLQWTGDRFHSREPAGLKLQPYRPIAQGQGGVMHLWGASERRLRAKSAHYKMVERIRWPQKSVEEIDRMYSWAIHGEQGNAGFGTPKTWNFSKVPGSWWAPYARWMKYLDVDAEPWQEKACIELVKEYGPEPFSRLDLFGVVG